MGGRSGSSTGDNYGVYGYSSKYSGNSRYAGYFNGHVHIFGDLTVTGSYPLGSDEKIKENIEPMESVIENIKKMKVKKYNYKKDKKLQLPEGKKYGLTAQDLEKLYPEMVTEITYPYEEINEETGNPENKENGVEMVSYKAIYYDQLIPTLIKGLQEQQEMIEEQQTTIEDLVKRVEELEKK